MPLKFVKLWHKEETWIKKKEIKFANRTTTLKYTNILYNQNAHST